MLFSHFTGLNKTHFIHIKQVGCTQSEQLRNAKSLLQTSLNLIAMSDIKVGARAGLSCEPVVALPPLERQIFTSLYMESAKSRTSKCRFLLGCPSFFYFFRACIFKTFQKRLAKEVVHLWNQVFRATSLAMETERTAPTKH